MAYLRREPVGCGAVKHHRAERWSEIKRVWVADAVRRLRVGRRLLGELEARAVAAGSGPSAWTPTRSLTEAAALYRSAGYREVAADNGNPYAHHWFEKNL